MRWLVVGAVLLIGTQNGFGGPPEADADKSLKVLSDNVGIFPKLAVDLYPAKIKEKKKHVVADEEQRATLLARKLMGFEGDPDVILLQEIWSVKARDRLIKDMAGEYPYFKHPPTMDARGFKIQASGLIVFSKYPLDGYAFKEFTKGFGEDKAARKGIVGVRLTKDGRKVAVFTTHLQAGGKKDPSVKLDQLRECNEFIREFVGDDPNVIAVLAGDLNIRSTDAAAYNTIFTCLAGARDSYRAGLGPRITTTRNEKTPNKRIDYLLTFGEVEAVSTIVDPAGQRISDHLAIFGRVGLE